METFVLRVWTPALAENDDEPLRLRGLVEHMRFGEQRVVAFDSVEQLLTLLTSELKRPDDRPTEGGGR